MRLRSHRIFLFTLLFCPCIKAQDVHVHVSPTSTGTTASTDDFPTIQMALDRGPDVGPRGRLYLHIAPSTYRERVWVSPSRARTTLLGTRPYSRVVFVDTELPASLSPEGWSPWRRGEEPRNTFYAERQFGAGRVLNRAWPGRH